MCSIIDSKSGDTLRAFPLYRSKLNLILSDYNRIKVAFSQIKQKFIRIVPENESVKYRPPLLFL